MKRRMLFLSVLPLLALSSPAWAALEHYEFDPAHSSVVWQANHLGFSTYTGKFVDVTGLLDLDEQNPAASKVSVTISLTGLVTGNDKLNTHLKSPDFFNAEKFPEAKFVSTRVEPTGKNTAHVTGDFTLLGVTRPVTLDVTLNKTGEHPMTHKKTVGFNATATIKRSDFGMNFGIPNVADEIPLFISMEASEPQQQAKP